MNVDGVSIKIDMPTSQYGTLTLDGKTYNVHVTNMDVYDLIGKHRRGSHIFFLTLVGSEGIVMEPEWEDSYETP